MENKDRKDLAIIILNYNGRILLEKYLSSIVYESQNEGSNYPIIVVDNDSNDDSIDFLQQKYPDILIDMQPNKYLFSLNTVIKKLDVDYVFILNNDVGLEKDCIKQMLRHFNDNRVFSVQPLALTTDRKNITSGKRHIMTENIRYGIFNPASDVSVYDTSPTITSCGGSAIYDRKKFLELGGFDDIFYPAYWEDFDLCYRAWKRGWKSLFDPSSIVFHDQHSSISEYHGLKYINTLMLRNKFVFIFKEIKDLDFWRNHLLRILPRLIRRSIHGDWHYVHSYLKALLLIPKIIKRRRTSNYNILSDEDIWNLTHINDISEFEKRFNSIQADFNSQLYSGN